MTNAYARSAAVARKAKEAADAALTGSAIVAGAAAAGLDAAELTAAKFKDGFKRRRQDRALGALLSGHMERAAGDAGLTGRLATQWVAVCPLLAPFCWPVRVQRGVLTIAVTSDPVRQELQYLAPTLLEAVNMLAGYRAITSLRYERRSGTPPAGTAGAGMRGLPLQRAPRAAAVDTARSACEGVPDDDLKAALARLGAWVFQAP